MALSIIHQLLGIFVLRAVSCYAETVQDAWVNPKAPDFTSNATNGAIFNITWDDTLWQDFSYYEPDADVTNVDLWCMGYYSHQLAQLVSTQVSVNTTFSLQWKISLSEEDLNQTTAWVFRFLPHGTSATDSQLANDSISSPGLNIVQPGLPVTSTTSLRSTSTQVSSTIPATADANSATATTVSLATPIPSSAGLSTGAKAGIGIGASLGGVALIAIGFFVALRVRKRPVEDSGANLIKHSEGEHGDLVHEIDQGVASMVPRNKPLVSSTFYRSKSSKMGSELSSDTAAAELP